MNLKFEDKKAEQIMKGIVVSGIVYVSSLILNMLATFVTILAGNGILQGEIAFNIMSLVGIIPNILKPIAAIIFIKFVCDALYKLLKVLDIYIEKNGR